jgi:ABC-type nitrate/sulfonate/bicarbonate transport system substrate-binding protein
LLDNTEVNLLKKFNLVFGAALSLGLAACGSTAAPVSSSAGSAASSKPAASASAKPATSAAAASTKPAAAGSAAAKPGTVTVRVGGLGSAIDRAFFIGEDKGFFADQGIKLDLTTFRGASEALPLLATDKLDVGTGGSNPGFFNAEASGIGMKIVSDVTIIRPAQDPRRQTAGVMVRSDLAGQIKGVADLKGKTVAINALQGVGEEQIDKILQTAGLTVKDIDLVALPYPDQVSAMGNKKIDAAMMIDPFATLARQQKIGTPLFDLGKAMPNYPAQWLFYGTGFIKGQPDVARHFMAAHMKALRWDTDAFVNGKNKDEAVAIYMKHIKGLTPELLNAMPPMSNEINGNINMDAIQQDQAYFTQHGWQKQKVDPKEIVDTSFAEDARKALGPFPS